VVCEKRKGRPHARARSPRLAGPGRGVAWRGEARRGRAYVRHAREWSAEIRFVSLQGRNFLLPFYFLADKFMISCPVSIRIRNQVGLGL